jgi:hypothetical protein
MSASFRLTIKLGPDAVRGDSVARVLRTIADSIDGSGERTKHGSLVEASTRATLARWRIERDEG